MLEAFIQAFVLYFVVIDPIGNTPLFLSITQNQNGKEKIQTAVEGIVIASAVLILFSIIGQFILSYLNISLESFRIAGGIILFLIALEMLFNKRQERKERVLDSNKDKISIFPLAIPILAGPAAITSVIVIATKYQGDFTLQLTSIFGLIGVMILTLFLFLLLAKSDKFINKNITNIVSRVIAIILAALSIQYIVDGLLIIFNYWSAIKNYFFEATAIIRGTIITRDIDTDGLNNQYNNPKEKISIQNSFFWKIFIFFLLNLFIKISIIILDGFNAFFGII